MGTETVSSDARRGRMTMTCFTMLVTGQRAAFIHKH